MGRLLVAVSKNLVWLVPYDFLFRINLSNLAFCVDSIRSILLLFSTYMQVLDFSLLLQLLLRFLSRRLRYARRLVFLYWSLDLNSSLLGLDWILEYRNLVLLGFFERCLNSISFFVFLLLYDLVESNFLLLRPIWCFQILKLIWKFQFVFCSGWDYFNSVQSLLQTLISLFRKLYECKKFQS